jgi:hypothetical protein
MALRSLHLIDIENLAGGGHLDCARAVAAAERYRRHIPAGDHDLTVVAAGPTSLVAAGVAFANARLVLGRGLDGADRALVEVLATDPIVDRVDRIVLASGDGIFTEVVASLHATGFDVWVAARREALSTRLRVSAGRVVTWPTGCDSLTVAA